MKNFADLQDERSFVKCQRHLYDMWHFKNEDIVHVLEHYKGHGKIKEYGEIHYLILEDLIELHFKALTEKEQRAFLAYNRARLSSFYSSNALNMTLTFVTAILTPFLSNMADLSEVDGWDVFSLIALFVIWTTWAVMNLLSIKAVGSPAKSFYESLFSAALEKIGVS